MNIVWFLLIAAGVLIADVGDRAATRNPSFGCWWYGSWTAAWTAASALTAATGSWGWAAVGAACAVINGVDWWRHSKRRKRKRAAKALGAKSAALIASLARKMREVARVRPVPGGAR